MRNKKLTEEEKKECKHSNPKYCKVTGGLRCRSCDILLNDFGNPYNSIINQLNKPIA